MNRSSTECSTAPDMYSAQLPARRSLIPLQTISAQRTMSYDKTLALAKQREERALVESLAQELSQQILRRVTMLPAQSLMQSPAQPDVQSSADPAP